MAMFVLVLVQQFVRARVFSSSTFSFILLSMVVQGVVRMGGSSDSGILLETRRGQVTLSKDELKD